MEFQSKETVTVLPGVTKLLLPPPLILKEVIVKVRPAGVETNGIGILGKISAQPKVVLLSVILAMPQLSELPLSTSLAEMVATPF